MGVGRNGGVRVFWGVFEVVLKEGSSEVLLPFGWLVGEDILERARVLDAGEAIAKGAKG